MILKILLGLSLLVNVAAGVGWYSINHHPEDLLDDCMAVTEKAQASVSLCEKSFVRAANAMLEFKVVTETCIDKLGEVSKSIENKLKKIPLSEK